MANKAVDKVPPGPKLDALTAEKVLGILQTRRELPRLGRSELQVAKKVRRLQNRQPGIKCRGVGGNSVGFELEVVCSQH
jgi:hypothetical protein